jgi:hypothetical protein
MKLVAIIPTFDLINNIRYLIIEKDKQTNGFFLFFHEDLEKPCEWDMWFLTLDEAKKQAKYNYEIDYNEWKEVDKFV